MEGLECSTPLGTLAYQFVPLPDSVTDNSGL